MGVTGFAQSTLEEQKITVGGYFEDIYDQYGNKYNIKDLKAGEDKIINNSVSKNTLICSSGMFDLYFETGSGMENTSDANQNARRAVICQVFSDLTNFIHSPLNDPNNNTRVRIWVRNINNLVGGVPPGVAGLATSFYTTPGTVSISGIADNEIWKTINSGVDSYIDELLPLSVANNQTSPMPVGVYYHGMMAFNFNSGIPWNTNLSTAAPIGTVDLYTNVLHEVTHALGFSSLIRTNGQIAFGNVGFGYFSRYDTFLKNNANTNFLITNSGSCSSMYDHQFNPNLLPSILFPDLTSCQPGETNCNTSIHFVGSVNTTSVYTPNCFEPGSSLSHFEDLCISTPQNNGYFVMSDRTSDGINGITNTKRFLKPEERNALSDVGYKLEPTYGNNNVVAQSNINYGGVTTNGIDVVGANDGLSNVGIYTFLGNPGTTINLSGILNNDYHASGFECLEDITDTAALPTNLPIASGTTATTNIPFTSNLPGLHLLRYVPVNASGQKGNITYVYVYVDSTPNCGTTPTCNMVINGSFEEKTVVPSGISQIDHVCNWNSISTNTTPDYLHRGATNASVKIPCNQFGSENEFGGLDGYLGMWMRRESTDGLPYYESIRTELSSSLLANTTYELSFNVSLAEAVSANAIKFQAYLSSEKIVSATTSEIPISNPAFLFTNPTFSTNTNGWGQQITFTINTNQTSNLKYLYIGGLSGVEFSTQTPATQIAGCNNISGNNTGFPAQRGYSYYYIDQIKLIPKNEVHFQPIGPVCSGATPQSLPATSIEGIAGTWTPSTISNTTSGPYVFHPTTANCSPDTTINITVIPSVTPTFNAVAAICPGTTVPTLPTTSTNTPGITGSWALVSGTTYNFTPNAGQCATTTSLTIPVLSANDPSCTAGVCQPNLTLSTAESASIVHKTVNWIETNTNYTTSIGQDIKSKAGDFIYMKPNTFIKAGSLYLAKIETCTSTSKSETQEPEYFEKEKGEILNIYPNPTNDLATISSLNSAIKSITISSIEGKIIYTNNAVNTNSYLLNVNNYKNGVFIVTIETIDGKTFRQKLIKN